MHRRKAREAAFHLIFEERYRPEEFAAAFGAELKRYFEQHGELPQEETAYVAHLVQGVLRERETILGNLAATATNWRLDRINRAERAIMELALFEMRFPGPDGLTLPKEIVIDEAVELTKIYGGDDSPAFVNGVLDALAGQGSR